MATNNATIFSAQVNNYEDEVLLREAIEELLAGLEQCQKSTRRLDGKTKYPNELGEAIGCLSNIADKIEITSRSGAT